MEQKLLPPRHSPCYTHWYIRSPPGPTSHTRILTSSSSSIYIYICILYIPIIVQSFINSLFSTIHLSKTISSIFFSTLLLYSIICNYVGSKLDMRGKAGHPLFIQRFNSKSWNANISCVPLYPIGSPPIFYAKNVKKNSGNWRFCVFRLAPFYGTFGIATELYFQDNFRPIFLNNFIVQHYL